jgi:bifunctional oligoribonuclease and PAP phosphatase NrnA
MSDGYSQMIDAISRARRVLVTTHVRPDGDAVGSVAAMARALGQKSIQADVLLLSHLPSKYAFVFEACSIRHRDVEAGWPADFSLEGYDGLLVIDTGTWSQLPGLEKFARDWPGAKWVIDHHLTQENWANVSLVDNKAGAAAEVVEELLGRWGVKLDAATATALFVAIVSDTGWFQFSSTRPQTLRLAATLMEAGVDTDGIYQHLYQNERAARVALQTRAQQSMELLAEGQLAVMTIGKGDFEQTRANVPDTENLINIPLQIRTVRVSALIVEPPDSGPIRVSLRSKGEVDVARFAEQFGGGGHARAAGLKLACGFKEARDRVVAAMLKMLS